MAALEDTTSRKGTWIVEGNRAGRYGVMVARSVVCPTSQAVPVRLLNPREESVVVRKGVQIARMEQLDDMCVGNVLPAPRHPQKHPPRTRTCYGIWFARLAIMSLPLRKKNCIICCWSTVMYFLSPMTD